MTAGRPDVDAALGAVWPMWAEDQVIASFARWHPAAVVFYRPASEALLDAAGVGPGTHALDIGTGTGIPALLAAELVRPGGTVVATDPSAGMLAVAEVNARAAGLDNLSFQRAAVEALPFPAASFDAVVSQLGLMFAADLPRALAEVRRVLRRGGRAAFLAWGPYERNPFWSAFWEIAHRDEEESPANDERAAEDGTAPATDPGRAEAEAEPDPRGPFRFAEPETLLAALRTAGFADVRGESRTIGLRLPSAEPIVRFWLDNGEAHQELPEDRRDAFLREVATVYDDFATSDGVELPAAFVLASGAAP